MSQAIFAATQVTPAWLTESLRRSGALPRGNVRTAAVTRVHDVQVHTISYFYALEYSTDAPAEAPRRLFLKIPREIATLLANYQERTAQMVTAGASSPAITGAVLWALTRSGTARREMGARQPPTRKTR